MEKGVTAIRYTEGVDDFQDCFFVDEDSKGHKVHTVRAGNVWEHVSETTFNSYKEYQIEKNKSHFKMCENMSKAEEDVSTNIKKLLKQLPVAEVITILGERIEDLEKPSWMCPPTFYQLETLKNMEEIKEKLERAFAEFE